MWGFQKTEIGIRTTIDYYIVYFIINGTRTTPSISLKFIRWLQIGSFGT